MEVIRVFHRRAPLTIRRCIGKKEVTPIIAPEKANDKGGCTIVVTADTENPLQVKVQVGWCRFTDSYNRKLGVKMAKAKDPELVELRELPRTLEEIEDQMLCQYSPYLRRQGEERADCRRNWDFAVRYFLPKSPKETNAQG